MAGVALLAPAAADRVGIGSAMGGGVYVEAAVRPQLRDETRPVVQGIPVRVTDGGEEAAALLLADADGGFHPRAERVLPHGALKVEGRLVLQLAERGDDVCECGYLRLVEGEAEAAFLAVLVGFVAGELAESVFVGDAGAFEVVEDVGEECEEWGVGVGPRGERQHRRVTIGCRDMLGRCWRVVLPDGGQVMGTVIRLAVGEI
jgi:hypothetical protein